MSESFSPDDVRLNSGTGRFELSVDEDTAFINYRVLTQGEIGFIHAEVPDALEGRGVGSALVHGALEIARRRDWTVLPYCPFVHGWMKRNPEYADLVSYRYPKRHELQPAPDEEEAEEEDGTAEGGHEGTSEDGGEGDEGAPPASDGRPESPRP